MQELLACSLPTWYPAFEAVTIKSVIIPLPAEFITYLTSGGALFLPPAPAGVEVEGDDPRFEPKPAADVEWEVGDAADHSASKSGHNDGDNVSDSDSDSDDEAARPPAFPEVEAAIRAAIARFGSVFPRLNWSAPMVRGVVYACVLYLLACLLACLPACLPACRYQSVALQLDAQHCHRGPLTARMRSGRRVDLSAATRVRCFCC
jgi:hypothetical protein